MKQHISAARAAGLVLALSPLIISVALIVWAFTRDHLRNESFYRDNLDNIINFPLAPTIYWFDNSPRKAKITIHAPAPSSDIFRHLWFHWSYELKSTGRYTIIMVTAKLERKIATIAINDGQSVSFMAPPGIYELKVRTGDVLIKSSADLSLAKHGKPDRSAENEVYAIGELHIHPGMAYKLHLDEINLRSSHTSCRTDRPHVIAKILRSLDLRRDFAFGCRVDIEHEHQPVIQVEAG